MTVKDEFGWETMTAAQLGRYGEYYAKMQFARAGLDIYTAEVDDKGIDFVVRASSERYLEIQVKSVRKWNYVYMRKKHLALHPNRFLALVAVVDEQDPHLFMIPTLRWKKPDELFKSYDYEGKKSAPEWGLALSKTKAPKLKPFKLEETLWKEKILE